jgi:acyl carrier protein
MEGNAGMSDAELRQLLIELLKRIAGTGGVPEQLDDHQPLHEQIRLDSMDYLDLVIEIRKELNVQIPESDYKNLRSLASLVNYLGPLTR